MRFWIDSVRWGCLVGVLAHIPAQLVLMQLSSLNSIFLIGVSQLIYIVPLAILAARNSAREMVKGLLIVAGITFLLNAACFGVVFAMLDNF